MPGEVNILKTSTTPDLIGPYTLPQYPVKWDQLLYPFAQ